MIKNDQYCKFLRNIITCISYGDYYSVKELACLELEKMKMLNDNNVYVIKKLKYDKKQMKNLKLLTEKELRKIILLYSSFIQNKVNTSTDLECLRNELITIEEFIDKT